MRYFSGDLGKIEADRLLDHAARCQDCRLRLRVLASIQTELKIREKDVPEVAFSSRDEVEFRKMAGIQAWTYFWKKGATPPRLLRIGGVLAAGLLLVFLGFRLFSKISAPELTVRGRNQVQIELHRPEGRLSEAPKIFSWAKVNDTDFYHLEIVDDDLNLVFSTSPTGTRFHLPDDIRLKLARQKSYLWTVSAYDDNHRELGSGFSYFEID